MDLKYTCTVALVMYASFITLICSLQIHSNALQHVERKVNDLKIVVFRTPGYSYTPCQNNGIFSLGYPSSHDITGCQLINIYVLIKLVISVNFVSTAFKLLITIDTRATCFDRILHSSLGHPVL